VQYHDHSGPVKALNVVYMFPAGTPEAENSPKEGLGMGTLGGPAEKNRKLQKK